LLTYIENIHRRLILIQTGKSKVKEELFWKNYFFHCETTRAERLRQEQRQTQQTFGVNSSDIEIIANSAEMKKTLDRVVSSIGNDDTDDDEDGESLIPAESSSADGDDSSYVIASAPASVNTITTTRSIDDDVVLITSPHPGGCAPGKR
jgi:hypothetical protein